MIHGTGVVLVNHHSEAMIAPRAELLLAADLDVVVVDNSASYAGPGRVIDAGANVGFGAACNIGERALDPVVDVVCLHNPDVDTTPGTIHALAERLRATERPGALAPAVRDATRLRPAGYRYPSPGRELALAAGLRHRSSRRTAVASTTGERFGTAALLLVAREAWHQVSGFDERFFLYAEDLDLWHRVATAPRSVGFAPDIVVDHAQGEGSHLGRSNRELLRWTGVELFAATSGAPDWRILRRIHRLALARHQRTAPALAAALRDSYRRADDPETVARVIHGGLVDGSLLKARRRAAVPT